MVFLMYKRLDNGAFRVLRSADEAMAITDDQYPYADGRTEIVARHPISELGKRHLHYVAWVKCRK